MPKQTFLNLDQIKQDTFVNAFLREFTIHRYDSASISSVLKELDMAKGSFYQYFENKKDLFLYLIQLLSETKMRYTEKIKRSNYNDFWAYWKAVYKEGMQFDADEPRMSNFGYRLMENMNSPSLKPLLAQFQQQGLESIKTMIAPEIESGAFRNDIDPDRMAFFIFNSSKELMEFIMLKRQEDFEARIAAGEPIFKGKNKQLLFESLDDFIRLQSAAITTKK